MEAERCDRAHRSYHQLLMCIDNLPRTITLLCGQSTFNFGSNSNFLHSKGRVPIQTFCYVCIYFAYIAQGKRATNKIGQFQRSIKQYIRIQRQHSEPGTQVNLVDAFTSFSTAHSTLLKHSSICHHVDCKKSRINN
jgi:hypothetical protein